MYALAKEQLKKLMAPGDGPCVSLYMPTHRSGAGTQQDPIRFRNLLRAAEERLRQAGLRAPDATAFLHPAHALLRDGFFWRHLSDGLALFVRRGLLLYYRVPRPFDESLIVAGRFYIKPLLPLVSEGGRFYVLALSQNAVRLLQGTPDGVRELELPTAPHSLAEDLEPIAIDKDDHYHSAAGPRGGVAGYFGAADEEQGPKTRLAHYCQQIEQGVHQHLRDEHAPLLLAGVEYLLPRYREVSRYRYLLDTDLLGSPDRLSATELQQRAWEIVGPVLQRAQTEAVAQFRHMAGTTRTTSDLASVIRAARHGRVEVMFVVQDVELWGQYDEAGDTVDVSRAPRPEDDDLLDTAAVDVLLHGGSVHALTPEQMPAPAPLAAILRY